MQNCYCIEKELMLAISDLRLNGTQWLIFWNVFINNNDNASREMPLSVLEQVTSCCKKQVQRELKKMLQRKIIIEVCKPNFVYARVLNINKNINEWIYKN